MAESGQAGCLHQLEFARQMHGAHRVVVPQAGAGSSSGGGGSGDEVQALQVGGTRKRVERAAACLPAGVLARALAC